MSYTELLHRLLKLKLIEKCTLNVNLERLPPNFDANAQCEFHYGAQGHNIENSFYFKHKVHDLLDSQAINFGPVPTPNILQQPLPPYGGAVVNAIIKDEGLNLMMDANLLTTPLSFMEEELLKKGVFPGCATDCEECLTHPEGCDCLKSEI